MSTRVIVPASVTIALAVVFGILLTTGPAQALPPISWQPEPFDIALPPGEKLSTTLTVTSSRDIPASRVEVSPSLAPYVASIKPATVPALPKGSTAEITLIFQIATGAPKATISGLLTLRDPNSHQNGAQMSALPISLSVGDLLYPPDPGEAGKETLEGIDSDGDGLRDDIQRYIEMTYSEEPAVRAGLGQYARELQAGLLVANAKDRTASRDKANALSRAKECLEYFIGSAAYDVTDDVRSETLNTEARSRAFLQHDHNLGGTIINIPIVPDPATCTFDINTMR